MADLSDLNYKSITEMSSEEAISLITQIRFKRRMPAPKKTKKKAKATPSVSASQAAELLKIIQGG